ncbi:hypothetical protein P9139_18150 [Curtobacterium flaccumfaciens]|nr:hypothetical protein P9139_18150 [Curtobacterium flaccumfaciens]
MTRWKYMAQRATTKTWLHRDIPFLKRDTLELTLSAAGQFKASISPDIGRQLASDGRPLFEELGTVLYAVAGGQIRWAGIVQSSAWNGQEWSVEASSFASYPHRIPFLAEYRGVQVDPADIMRALWAHVQSYPDGNLGVVVTGTTGLKVGTDSDEKADAATAVYDAKNATYTAAQTELARLKKIVANTRATTLKTATAAKTAANTNLSGRSGRSLCRSGTSPRRRRHSPPRRRRRTRHRSRPRRRTWTGRTS